MKQPGYDEEFDGHTVLYDLFWSADGTRAIGIGPPIANLATILLPALRWAFCLPWLSRLNCRNLDRCFELRVRHPKRPIVLPAPPFLQARLRIQPNLHRLFQGKKVALTKSRDNPLPWLRDWAYFHAEAHGCNAVLLYDNASTAYGLADIEATLSSVPGIDTAVVVSWPFKFGPQGGMPGSDDLPWDSDYCQFGILEHARHRFLATADAVLQGDPDELVITDDGVPVFQLAAQSSTGYVRYRGRWIESATETSGPGARRHLHYRHYDATSEELPAAKWTVIPSRCPQESQWRVHEIAGMTPDAAVSARASLRHFRALNTNWRMERWRPETLDPSRHQVDEELVRWLKLFEAGWPSPLQNHASSGTNAAEPRSISGQGSS